MPPKKKTKTASTAEAPVPASAIRTTRTSARNKAPLPPPPELDTASNGKRKRASAIPISVESDSDVELVSVPVRSRAKVIPRKTTTGRGKEAVCEKWFQEYAESGAINPNTFQGWMDDMGVSSDGVFMYFVLWKCQAATQMSISKEEFVKFMNEIGASSNAKLLSKLPALLDAIRPTIKATPNPQFKPFYKWCFNHFKADGSKNISVDVAQILFQTLLDGEKYSPSWTPSNANGRVPESKGCAPGDFPHVNAFVEFLSTDPKPVAVITKDQYDQFYEFNASVSWNLSEHSEDSAWPALLDNYVNWKKNKYPTPAAED